MHKSCQISILIFNRILNIFLYKIIIVFSKYMNIINIKYFGFIKMIIDLFRYTISIGEKKKYESEI